MCAKHFYGCTGLALFHNNLIYFKYQ